MRPEAAALYERLFGNKDRDAAVADRIPPGQYRTEKFPVLHYGSVPKTDLATWDFKVYGLVDAPFTLTWDAFKALPRLELLINSPKRFFATAGVSGNLNLYSVR